jgi:RNA polymerase sigma-70 factor (ECF subfamily)
MGRRLQRPYNDVMSDPPANPDSTCWVLIQGAAAGKEGCRDDFARRYEPVVRAYLAHRWRSSPLINELEDSVQDVFVECFRRGGVLDQMREQEPDSFRAFLYGVTRNVELRLERSVGRKRRKEPPVDLDPDTLAADDATLSRVFDRAWARAIFRQAGMLQEERARVAGKRALKRVELLRLRSSSELPVREIACLWKEDPAAVHKEYARARNEFRAALRDVVAFHHPRATGAEIESKCAELLALLQGA